MSFTSKGFNGVEGGRSRGGAGQMIILTGRKDREKGRREKDCNRKKGRFQALILLNVLEKVM